MAKKNKFTPENTPFRHANHERPVTRRQFLAQGFLSGGALVTGPSLLGLFGRSNSAYAQAAACGVQQVAAQSKIPFIAFDLAGGASIAGSNVMVGGQGGQKDFLPADGYVRLGIPTSMAPNLPGQINEQLGLVFHADSAFLRGILSKAGAATLANTNGVVICTRSNDDTQNNPHNPIYGINKAGADGDLVQLIGTRTSDSGGNSIAPGYMVDASAKPTKIAAPADATGLIDTGRLGAILPAAADSRSLLNTVERISALKAGSLTESQIVKDLIGCAYTNTTSQLTRFASPGVLDPRQDPNITTIFPTITGDKINKTATVMKLVIDGYAAAGTIEFGGYDYHDGTRATGEVRDFQAGECIGAVLQYAAVKNTPVMIYVFSDGGIASGGNIDNSVNGRGKGVWNNDSSSRSAAFFLVFNPNGRPQLTSPTKQQLGFYRATGDIDTAATPISNNVQQLAEAIVLNYLALHGEVGRFKQVLPNSGIAAAVPNLDDLVCFAPIV